MFRSRMTLSGACGGRVSCTPEMTVTADADAVDALARMHRAPQSYLPVMERDRLTGILARKDLLRFLALGMEREERPR